MYGVGALNPMHRRGDMNSDIHMQFSEMYEANYVDLLRYVQRRAHPAIVDDVVGETFAIAWRRKDDLPDEPRPWLFRTAANVIRSTVRGRRHQVEAGIRAYEGLVAGPDHSRVEIIDLIAAWRSLRRADREVLALHVWEDMTDGEAAQVLGQTRAAYSMRLTRAKRRLAVTLEGLESSNHEESTTSRLKEETS
jgi:RNA polymerase sigma factor (sigma-70 family)